MKGNITNSDIIHLFNSFPKSFIGAMGRSSSPGHSRAPVWVLQIVALAAHRSVPDGGDDDDVAGGHDDDVAGGHEDDDDVGGGHDDDVAWAGG